MFKKSLRIEQLERKVLFAGVADTEAPVLELPETTTGPVEVEISEDHLHVAGDANRDGVFDRLDIVELLEQDKYLKDEPADWSQGDFNGDGRFDHLDMMFQTGQRRSDNYAAIAAGGTAGDNQTSIIYNPSTGEIAVDAPAGTELTSICIESATSILTGEAAQNLGGSWDNDADDNIFKGTFGGSFGSLSFGYVALAGRSQDFVLNDLTVVGSLAGGGDLGDVDLIYV